MKKSLETELMNLAERILHMKNRADIHELKVVSAVLYEKLSVLSFAEKHFEGAQPAIAKKHVEDALGERMDKPPMEKNVRQEHDENRYAPDGTQFNPEGITEPNTEKIKDIVAQMPPGTEEMDEVLDDILPEENKDDDLRNIAVHYDDLPQFEPVEKKTKDEKTHVRQNDPGSNEARYKQKETNPKEQAADRFSENKRQPEVKSETPSFERKEKIVNNEIPPRKSLNDRLKKGVSFGLNERLVFVKHLFEGSASDYDRVLSQLNTFHSYDGAKRFIETVVKPDYNWEGQEQYEKRFLEAIKNKLN